MLNHCIRSGTILLLLCFLPVTILFGQAQLTVDLPSQSSQFTYEDLWNVQFNNLRNEPFNARLEIQVNEASKGEILKVTVFLKAIQTGVSNIAYDPGFSLNFVNVNFIDPDFNEIISNARPFPTGNYSISWEIDKNIEIGYRLNAYHKITIINDLSLPKQEQPIQITPEKNTNGHIGVYSFVPQDTLKAYLQVDAKVGFNLGNIPFYFDGLFATNPNDQEQINRIGFHFDAPNYKNALREKIAQRMDAFEEKKLDKIASLSKLNSYVDKNLFAAFIEGEMAGIKDMNLSFREGEKQEVSAWKEKYKRLVAKKEMLEKELGLKDRDFELNSTEGLSQGLAAYGFFQDREASDFWVHTERFSLGHSYPVYSPLTISGSRIFGIDWAYSNKAKYVAISAGRLQQKKFLPFVNTYDEIPDTLASRHHRNIIASQLGIGFRENSRKNSHFRENSYFSITGMYAYDIENSIDTDLEGVGLEPEDFKVKPKSNLIFASELKLAVLPKNPLYFEGEVSSSTVRRNRQLANSEDKNAAIFEDIPFWSKWFGVDLETTHDFAYRGSLVFKPGRSTNLMMGYNYIGAGYESFAVPFLRNDLKRWEFRGEQGMLNNRISLKAYYRQDRYDLLDSLKNDLSSFRILGGQVQLIKLGLSSIVLGYQQSKQNNDIASSFRTNLAHRYSTGNILHSSAFTFGIFESRDNDNIGAILYNIQHQIKFPFSLELLGQLYFNRRNEQKNNQSNVSVAYSFKKNWKNEIGWRRYDNDINIRNDYYLESSFNINQNFTASLFLERDEYEFQQQNYPFAFRFSARYRW